MQRTEFNNLLTQAESRKLAIRVGKGKEYTVGSDDVLANFKTIAKELEGVAVTPLVVLYIYWAKHKDAFLSYVRNGKEFSSEGIEGRIDDLQIYLDLARACIEEQKKHEAQKSGDIPGDD